MEYLLGVLILLILLLASRYYFLLKGINAVRKQLKTIHGADATNQLVTHDYHFFELNELIQEVNKGLVKHRENLVQSRLKEQILKEQMTHISHDLRTPLASILGYFELMNDAAASTVEKNQYLKMIEKRAQLLQALLTHYYDLARIESSEYHVQMSNVEVGALLAETLALFYSDFSNKQIDVKVNQEHAALNTSGDRDMLRRVFVNLIENVLKHGVKQCKIIHQINDEQAWTTIMNQTAKPNQIVIEQVFNRLYTADLTRNFNNTGIGLTIVQLLLEKMGHQVSAQLSEAGWFSIVIHWRR